MKALIMAAGKGSRISGKIDGIPKCILPLADGTPIIRRSVQMMLELGIAPVLCLGYEREQIKESLRGLAVQYYYNPFFEVTNNVASLWFTRTELDGSDDILLLSGDLFYPKEFLCMALETKYALAMFADSSRICDGDFYLNFSSDGGIAHYGPQLPFPMRQYEYMGITKISADFVLPFSAQIAECVEAGNYQTYFENVLFLFSKKTGQAIRVIDVAGSFWREFDYYEDYELILAHERAK